LWIQTGFGTSMVFVAVGAALAVSALFVPLLGPEARGRSLEELAPDAGADPAAAAAAPATAS
jgi:hypothetical protein